MRKNIKISKGTDFAIDVETNLKIVDFLDITFNLHNGTYRPYKSQTIYYHILINLQWFENLQMINQLPKAINERLSRNSSN